MVKTSVVSCWSIRSFRVSYIIELTMSDERVVMSSVGHMTFRSSCFFEPDSISTTSRTSPFGSHPTRYPAIASMGARVAERPILTKSVSQWCLSLSRVSERNAPLFESHMSWISSRITHSTFLNASLNFGAARMSARLSGVVMSMCGGCLTILCLSFCGVSPERTATLMSGTSMPWAAATSLISASGVLRLRFTSLARALSGET